VHALDHRAFLRGHEAGGLGSGDADGVLGLVRIEPQHARGRRTGGEGAGRALRMPAAEEEAHGPRHADARPHLVAGDQRRDHIAARASAFGLGTRERDGHSQGARMKQRSLVHVVAFERVGCRAVGERRLRCRGAEAGAEYGRAGSPAFFADHLDQAARPRQRRAVKRTADRIEREQLRMRDDFLRQIAELEAGDEFGQGARGAARNDGEFLVIGLSGIHGASFDTGDG
jgi:hypothetical protein